MVPNEDTISIRTLKYCSLSCAKLGSVRRTFWSIRVIFEIFIRVIKSFNRFNFSPIFCQNPSQKCSLFFFKINLEFSFVMTKMRLKLASEKSFKVLHMMQLSTYWYTVESSNSNRWIVNNLTLVDIFLTLTQSFYNINYMLNSKQSLISKHFWWQNGVYYYQIPLY